MKRNILMFISLFVLMLAMSGCRAAGQAQRPLFGYGFQLPTTQQTQQTLGRFGRNFGNRLVNGVMNTGVNYLIRGAIQAL